MFGKRVASKQSEKKKKIGFTDKLSLYILCTIFITILMGFFLALKSIEYNYVGSLICFTAAIAPLDSALAFVLSRVVDKNKAENTAGNGDGIKFAAAQATRFANDNDINSPAI